MACGSCGTSSNGLPKGCNNNGACGTDGCGKLSVFDWLANMQLPNGQQPFNFVEVRFKNDRKFYYKNENNISLNVGDIIAVEGTPGHDIGIVTLTGELVRIQMKKKNLSWEGEEVKKVYRKANQKDIETWQEFREREKQTMIDARIMAKNLNLEMKICDVEYQGDGAKVTFYYTAEGRVDFRQLIKEYASKFGVRIEMIVHVILGLPFEDKKMMMDTVDYVTHKGHIQGIKLQLLHVLSDTDLGRMFLEYGEDAPERLGLGIRTPEEYIELLAQIIRRLPEDTVVHRITGDAAHEKLLYPMWSANKRIVLNGLRKKLTEINSQR